MLLLPRLIGGYSGVMEKFGYHNFFMITCLMGVPTLFLIALHWFQENRRARLNPLKKQTLVGASLLAKTSTIKRASCMNAAPVNFRERARSYRH